MAVEKLSAAERVAARTKSYANREYLENELRIARESVEYHQSRLRVLKQALRMKGARKARVEA